MLGPQIYITIGDEYDKKDQIPERYKGRNFKTIPPKKGNLPDALFSKKFLSLSEGDKFVDPGTYEKRHRLESEKKKLTPQGFKYANYPHRPCGSGSYWGTFNEKNPPKHEVEFVVAKKSESPEPPKASLRNIVTSPPKRGTYGFPGVTLSKGDEMKYVSDPYEGEKRREALTAKESSKRIVGPPFKAACKRAGFFDETTHGISKVYSITKALPAKKVSTEEKKALAAKPWKPAGTLVAAITKPPEYQEDPFELKEKKMREDRKKEKPRAVWKPISSGKTLPTRPIKFTPA